jgi:hypothetical protein
MGNPYNATQKVADHGAKNIENAVYAHIQAIRALGKTRVNTVDIARALGLPLREVEKTILP